MDEDRKNNSRRQRRVKKRVDMREFVRALMITEKNAMELPRER